MVHQTGEATESQPYMRRRVGPWPALSRHQFVVNGGVCHEVDGRKSTVAVIGKDNAVLRVYSLTLRQDGWWPEGYITCEQQVPSREASQPAVPTPHAGALKINGRRPGHTRRQGPTPCHGRRTCASTDRATFSTTPRSAPTRTSHRLGHSALRRCLACPKPEIRAPRALRTGRVAAGKASPRKEPALAGPVLSFLRRNRRRR